jgi:hypothetical protein
MEWMTFRNNDHPVDTSIRVLNQLSALCLAWHFFIWLTTVSLSCALKPLLMIFSSVMRGCVLVFEGEADLQYIPKGWTKRFKAESLMLFPLSRAVSL